MLMSSTTFTATAATDAAGIHPLREKFREEMGVQIVHDSIHRRDGWTRSWLLHANGKVAGFGSVAVDGPWKGRPTLFEFFVGSRYREFEAPLFAAFRKVCRARAIEAQTNMPCLARRLPEWAPVTITEKIVYRDLGRSRRLRSRAVVKSIDAPKQARTKFRAGDGLSEWKLELEGKEIGRGGIGYHYNRPYCDLFLEIDPEWRRQGFGAYFCEALKQACRRLGGVPAARIDPENEASRALLKRTGFVPCGEIVTGPLLMSV